MAFRYRDHARRRGAAAGMVGLLLVIFFGPGLILPGMALAALVYYAHQLAAVLADDDEVPYPGLAFVIVVNALVVLAVESILFVQGFSTG